MIQPITIGRATIYHADCLVALAQLPENSIDAVVTDPPYGLAFMGKGWDAPENIAFHPEVWRQVLRVLKPGGHLLAFGGTRTYHRLVCAIEDAGFEVRDQIGWAFGTGFPKSHDVALAIDKAARGVPHGGVDPTSVNHGKYRTQRTEGARSDNDLGRGYGAGPGQYMAEAGGKNERDYVPEAAAWAGWGTALKPAWEPICVARKPLVGTVAENVRQHGVGALNIAGCRVPTDSGRPLREARRNEQSDEDRNAYHKGLAGSKAVGDTDLGRWPANIIHDGSDEVEQAFAQFGQSQSRIGKPRGSATPGDGWGMTKTGAEYDDTGSPSRFFYAAKASKAERQGSKHPTVKPIALMRYLCRLVTPPGGTVLDPFAGTGTTAQAAAIENFNAILIEQEAQYIKDIQARLANQAGPLFS